MQTQVFEEFLSEEEEAFLISSLDGDTEARPWRDSRFNGSSRGKRYGVEMDLRLRTVSPASVPMPAWLDPFIERMRTLHRVLANYAPNGAAAAVAAQSRFPALRSRSVCAPRRPLSVSFPSCESWDASGGAAAPAATRTRRVQRDRLQESEGGLSLPACGRCVTWMSDFDCVEALFQVQA